MMASDDYAAGSIGGEYAWTTGKARRARQGVAGRRRAPQYANYQSSPRPGEREPIEREARGKHLPPAQNPGQMPPQAQMHGPRANDAKHQASIHREVGGGAMANALRGAPRTANIQAGRDTNRGGNRVSISGGRRK